MATGDEWVARSGLRAQLGHRSSGRQRPLAQMRERCDELRFADDQRVRLRRVDGAVAVRSACPSMPIMRHDDIGTALDPA